LVENIGIGTSMENPDGLTASVHVVRRRNMGLSTLNCILLHLASSRIV
jgi:hypothetical protein